LNIMLLKAVEVTSGVKEVVANLTFSSWKS